MHAPALAAPSPAPRVLSAGELCQVMRTAGMLVEATYQRGLDRVLRHDPARGELEVQAGVRWTALVDFQGASHFGAGTVGEAVAHNRPGPDGVPLVAHVRALTLATADGQLRRAGPERAPELFRLAVGGLGVFGPCYSITLDLGTLAGASRAAVEKAAFVPPGAAPAAPHHVLELLLPPECAEAVSGRVRDAVAERRFALARMEARRVLPEGVTLLRWARREYVLLRVEFVTQATLGACVAAAQLQGALIDLAIEAGGSFMPSSLPAATRAQAQACYPMLGEFLAERRRLDPGERVRSPWIRDAARVWRGERCTVRFGRD